MTIESQHQDVLEQYRRDKRHEIYVNLLTQLTTLETTLRQIELVHLKQVTAGIGALPPTQPEPLPADVTKQNDDKWQAAYDEFSTAISVAEMIGSKRVIELAKALRDAYSLAYYHVAYPNLFEMAAEMMKKFLVSSPGVSVVPAGPNSGAPPPLEYDPVLGQEPIWKLRSQFVEQAKTEIALND